VIAEGDEGRKVLNPCGVIRGMIVWFGFGAAAGAGWIAGGR